MLKLDHVVFPVRDAEQTLAFYRDILGLPLIGAHTGDDWDGYPWLMLVFGLRDGQEIVTVALHGAPSPDYRGVPIDARHYALSASSEADLEGWRGRLSEAEVEFWEERHGESRSIYFADPDSVILEITWPPSVARTLETPESLDLARRWIERARTPA
jgi:catechol 2,3-dioxygenase-like lactoylglutathione lyase family enzyme